MLFSCSSYDAESAPAPIGTAPVAGDAAKVVGRLDAEVSAQDAATGAPDAADANVVIAPRATCDSARAVGAVHVYAQAVLDVIAFAEGTAGYGAYDGYNVLFGFSTVSSCANHPNRVICKGSLCSTAAGRYQFLNRTWVGLALPSFEPEYQAQGAFTLVKQRNVTLPMTRALTATEFKSMMDKISYEWASIPPSRYGQPVRTASELRSLYCSKVTCA